METVLLSDFVRWLGDNHSWIQAISLICGVTYMVLQIFQHKWMWYFSIAASTAACIIASTNLDGGAWAPLWAQVALNVYLIVIAIIGIIHWRKLEKRKRRQAPYRAPAACTPDNLPCHNSARNSPSGLGARQDQRPFAPA